MTKYFLPVILCLIALHSCDFRQSVKKDLSTGAYTRGDGLSVDKYFMLINDEEVSRTEFIYGERVYFYFDNLQGLKRTDGKVYPGMSACVIQNDKDTMLFEPELLTELAGGTELTELQLNANIVCAFPYENGEKYKVFVTITDNDGEGNFIYEMPFTIKKNPVLNIKDSGLKHGEIYLWNEDQKFVVTQNEINNTDNYYILMDKIEGLSEKSGLVYPHLSMEIKDANGKSILSEDNLLPEYAEFGISANQISEGQMSARFTLGREKIAGPISLDIKLEDKKSDKDLVISTELKVN